VVKQNILGRMQLMIPVSVMQAGGMVELVDAPQQTLHLMGVVGLHGESEGEVEEMLPGVL